jgi:hypothetical protein
VTDNTVGQIDPYDGVDLGVYRYAVARLLRLLIRARLIQEPEFLTPDDRRRWQHETLQGDSRTIESFLLEVDKANDILYNTVLGPGNSVGIALNDPRAQGKETVISVMTSLWSLSDQWIDKASRGKQIVWDEVIPIDVVREIRDFLDSLPSPSRMTTTEPDGPVPPASFRWKGRTEKLTGKPWALVNFLWKQRKFEQDGETIRRANFAAIASDVWGNENRAFRRAIPSAASRATGMFEEAEIPIRLRVRKPDDKHQYVLLVISDYDT